MESRYNHPSRASRRAEEKRAARRLTQQRIGTVAGIASVSAAAAALVARHAVERWRMAGHPADR
jgi:hypothetical protein